MCSYHEVNRAPGMSCRLRLLYSCIRSFHTLDVLPDRLWHGLRACEW